MMSMGEGSPHDQRNSIWKNMDNIFSNLENDIMLKSSGQLLVWDGYYFKSQEQEDLNKTIIQKYKHESGIKFIPIDQYQYVQRWLDLNQKRIINSARRFYKEENWYALSFDNLIYKVEARETGENLPMETGRAVKPRSRHRIPYEYNERATCPNWESFLKQVFEGDEETIKMVQKYCGYILLSDCRYKKALFLIGTSGNNGKTTFIKTIQNVIGRNNSIERTLDQLNRTFNVLGLEDKLLIVDSDMSCIKQNDSSNFKKITSGEPLMGEKKYGNNYEMTTSAKLMMASNVVPKISLDKGTVNRCLFAVFEKSFSPEEQDMDLESKLDSEKAGIFNWIVKGMKLLKEEGLDHSAKSKAMLGDFLESNSSCEGFWQEHLEHRYFVTDSTDDFVSRKRVYEDYKNYCHEYGHSNPLKETNFWRKSYAHLHLLAKEKCINNAADYFRKTDKKEIKRTYDGKQLRVVIHLRLEST